MKILKLMGYFLLMSMVVVSCKSDDDDDPKPDPETPFEAQVRVQTAFDANEVAFRFVWKSQGKKYPEGFANVGQNYPSIFHDFLKHNGEKFDRLPSGTRLDEDRVTFTIDKYDSQIPGFAKANCAVTCHTDMARHNLEVDMKLDHWHWRGGRSGPMGYAEDAAIDNVERIRDNLGTMPTNFIRSGGDRLRENQDALQGEGHPVLADGLPRFVLNKGKTMHGNYVIPHFFMADGDNNLITDPHSQVPAVKDAETNRSLLVIYQDLSFDNVDKVNAIDLAYLAWLSTGSVDHLPEHLNETDSDSFNAWKQYWATVTGISDAGAATSKLDDVHAEWVSSGSNAVVTRSVGFIYNSDQHDIRSESNYNTSKNEWEVVLIRKLSTGSDRDVDLAALPSGGKFSFAFAMHDAGGGGITHDISLPLVLSTDDEADIKATSVNSISNIDWSKVPVHDTYWVKQSAMPKYTLDYLRDGAHAGASVFETMKCVDCHKDNQSLLTTGIIN